MKLPQLKFFGAHKTIPHFTPHSNISRQLDENGARSVVDLLVSTGHAEWNDTDHTT